MKRFVTFLLIAAGICCIVYIANNHEEIFAKQHEQIVNSDEAKSQATKPKTTTPATQSYNPKTTTNKSSSNTTGKPHQTQSTATTQKASESKPSSSTDSKHLSFKGIPIDGTLSAYVGAMRNTGFSLLKSSGGVAHLKGDFAGHKGCIVAVSTLSNHDLVCRIDVTLTHREKWANLSEDYTTLKRRLSQKYGTPAKCVEKFDRSYVDDDNSRLFALKFDRCKYYSIFKTAKGDITLRIDHNDYDCYVSLTYADKINSAKVNDTIMNDL